MVVESGEQVVEQQGTGHADRVRPDVGHVAVLENIHQGGAEASMLMPRFE